MKVTWAAFDAAKASDPDGVEAVLRAADSVKASRRGLAWAIVNESGWNPAAVNSYTKAQGLMQIVPMRGHEYAANASRLSRDGQAPVIARYLSPYRGKFTDRESDVYLAIAYPEALLEWWPDDRVVSVKGGGPKSVWFENPAWRTPGNGDVTVGSIRAYGGEPPAGGPSDDVPPGPATPPAGAVETAGGGSVVGACVALLVLAFAAWRARHV